MHTLLTNLNAVIDGRMQQMMTSVAFWHGLVEGKWMNRVTLTWAVPTTGFEFDGRLLVGTEDTVEVYVFCAPGDQADPILVRMPMKVASFACKGGVGDDAVATCVFEAEKLPKSWPTNELPPPAA